jgi:hypothetical protein
MRVAGSPASCATTSVRTLGLTRGVHTPSTPPLNCEIVTTIPRTHESTHEPWINGKGSYIAGNTARSEMIVRGIRSTRETCAVESSCATRGSAAEE